MAQHGSYKVARQLCRGVASGAQAPGLRLLAAVNIGVLYTMSGFAATALYFSDAERDPSFRSKRIVAGFCLVWGTAGVVIVNVDLLRYIDRWAEGEGVILLVCFLYLPVLAFERAPGTDAHMAVDLMVCKCPLCEVNCRLDGGQCRHLAGLPCGLSLPMGSSHQMLQEFACSLVCKCCQLHRCQLHRYLYCRCTRPLTALRASTAPRALTTLVALTALTALRPLTALSFAITDSTETTDGTESNDIFSVPQTHQRRRILQSQSDSHLSTLDLTNLGTAMPAQARRNICIWASSSVLRQAAWLLDWITLKALDCSLFACHMLSGLLICSDLNACEHVANLISLVLHVAAFVRVCINTSITRSHCHACRLQRS